MPEAVRVLSRIMSHTSSSQNGLGGWRVAAALTASVPGLLEDAAGAISSPAEEEQPARRTITPIKIKIRKSGTINKYASLK